VKQIEPYRLWLGHAGDGRDIARIVDTGIHAVVQLAIEEPLLALPRELTYVRLPLDDGPTNLSQHLLLAISTLAMLVRREIPTLVYCSAGASRSPAIAACALAEVESRSPTECLLRIRKCVGTDISPGLWQQLLALNSAEHS
jgi:hypothetical protein